MARTKIDYGIDLGTTNSALCRMEKGEPIIRKTDTLKDTMPSCVAFTKKGSAKAGDAAYNTMKSDKRAATKGERVTGSNAFIEFKRTMGTNVTYRSENAGRSFTSEELSAEVLRTLKSFVTDETVNAAVVTVPAKFTVNQKTATLEAARMAGIEHCELLQEPIAAAMAYGVKSEEKNGYWMVFDFGGGTFDAALLKVEDGIMQVFDTEGDNYLGGKNLDYAIVDEILLPALRESNEIEELLADEDRRSILRDALKTYAEEAKNQLSFKPAEDVLSNLGEMGEDDAGEELELDLRVTQEEVFAVMRPLFQRAVDICQDLLKRNNLNGDQLGSIILVGGPTHSPLVRQMLREQIADKVDTSIDPMTAVACGAALYAATLDVVAKSAVKPAEGAVHLQLDYEPSSVESTEWVSVRVKSGVQQPSIIIESADGAWSSARTIIPERGEVFEVKLREGRANVFSVRCFDEQGNSLPCTPDEFTILQGTKVGRATLPYSIGIGRWENSRDKEVFLAFKGLEKNKPLPAKGATYGRLTSVTVHPGNAKERIHIPVYQVDDSNETGDGRSTDLFNYVADVVVTGEDVDREIPKGTEVDVTLHVDGSEQMMMEVYFPKFDLTVTKQLFTGKKQTVEEAERYIEEKLQQADEQLDLLEEHNIDTYRLRDRIEAFTRVSGLSADDTLRRQGELKELLRELERCEEINAWTIQEERLRSLFARLESGAEGKNDQQRTIVENFRVELQRVIAARNVAAARELHDRMDQAFVSQNLVVFAFFALKEAHNHLADWPWSDRDQAESLIALTAQKLQQDKDPERIITMVRDIYSLLPESYFSKVAGRLQ